MPDGSEGTLQPDGRMPGLRVRLLVGRALALLAVIAVAVTWVALVAWWPVRVLAPTEFSPSMVWRLHAAGLATFWVAGFSWLVVQLLTRRRAGEWLLDRRRVMINAGLTVDAGYDEARRVVRASTPVKRFLGGAGAVVLAAILMMIFVHAWPLDGWVRAVMVVSIVALLALPIVALAAPLEALVTKLDTGLADDL